MLLLLLLLLLSLMLLLILLVLVVLLSVRGTRCWCTWARRGARCSLVVLRATVEAFSLRGLEVAVVLDAVGAKPAAIV